MTIPRKLVKSMAGAIGVRVTRAASAGRFSEIGTCLARMRERGFQPKVVIDGGSNEGQFYELAHAVFPDACYHLVEPQPSCQDALSALVEARPRTTELHAVALTAPGGGSVKMSGQGTTGAHVTEEGEPFELEIPATSLDALFVSRVVEADRCLLKLDLESHELTALEGGRSLMARVEAVLLEVSFYDAADRGRAVFSNVMTFMTLAGFELYDVASLGARPRDERLRQGDVVFVRRGTPLLEDRSWG